MDLRQYAQILEVAYLKKDAMFSAAMAEIETLKEQTKLTSFNHMMQHIKDMMAPITEKQLNEPTQNPVQNVRINARDIIKEILKPLKSPQKSIPNV